MESKNVISSNPLIFNSFFFVSSPIKLVEIYEGAWDSIFMITYLDFSVLIMYLIFMQHDEHIQSLNNLNSLDVLYKNITSFPLKPDRNSQKLTWLTLARMA